MTPSKRIILNTLVTYLRSLLGAGLALFSSRWVLGSLGHTDFGLYNVVGSLIVFVTFFNTVMAGSASRHFAYAIGQGSLEEVNKWFNAAFSTHLIIPAILVVLGWPVGEYCIRQFLTIPPDRVDSCILVFRLSLISAFVGMSSVPFVAMFRAKQNIAELSLWEMLRIVLSFVLAWVLTRRTGNLLVFYAFGMVVISVSVNLAQSCRCVFVFPECRIRRKLWFDSARFKEILSFATWTFIGMFGGTLRNQGSGILLNIFFGPGVNAAYGIANQVTVQTGNLSAAMFNAFSPEITASEGRGDRERMLALSVRASKLGTLLVLLFAVPLIVEMPYVLKLWLGHPPEYCSALCRLMIVTFIIDRLSSGYMSAVNACGKIAAYQATLGTVLIMTLPLALLFVWLGCSPVSVGIAFIATMSVCSLGRVLWVQYLFGLPVHRWLIDVLMPCVVVALVILGAALSPRLVMQPSFYRLMLACLLALVAASLAIWRYALDGSERDMVRRGFHRFIE